MTSYNAPNERMTRIAKSARSSRGPTLEQIRHVIQPAQVTPALLMRKFSVR